MVVLYFTSEQVTFTWNYDYARSKRRLNHVSACLRYFIFFEEPVVFIVFSFDDIGSVYTKWCGTPEAELMIRAFPVSRIRSAIF